MGKRQIAWFMAAVIAMSAMTACTEQGQKEDAGAAATEQTAVETAEAGSVSSAMPAEEEVKTEAESDAGTDASAAGQAGANAAATDAKSAEQPEGQTTPPGAASTGQTAEQPGEQTTPPGAASTGQTAEQPKGQTTPPDASSAGSAGNETGRKGDTSEQPQAAESGDTSAGADADEKELPQQEEEKPDQQTPADEAGEKAETRAEDNAESLLPGYSYTLADVREVGGRQGIACAGGEYWVSGSNTLTHYDKDWKPVITNADLFKDFEVPVNSIGDIDVYGGEIYASAENIDKGAVSDIQIAVYDAQTLQLKRSYMIDAESGQPDCSGIAVDPDSRSIWLCSWSAEESGSYLYRYSMQTGSYIGKIHLQPAPQWLQGIAYDSGYLYMAADDGAADQNEPDHIYRWRVNTGSTSATVTLERTLDDVTRTGEVKGLALDKEGKKLLICHNRGAQIVQGSIKGYYDGYDREIHEIYIYDMVGNAWTIERGSDAQEKNREEEPATGYDEKPAEEKAGTSDTAKESESESDTVKEDAGTSDTSGNSQNTII